jgi:activator of HSP90 ATPase
VASNFLTRREISTRLFFVLAAMGIAGNAAAITEAAPAAADDEISRPCDCIHQEIVINASPAHVYQALVDPKQFSKITDFILPGASTSINPETGGEFSLFGGLILGRHIEMMPGRRLVQAWREKDWEPGAYSVVRFQLNEQGSATKIVFDHRGFPPGNAEHLAPGWKSHYWVPLQKFFA